MMNLMILIALWKLLFITMVRYRQFLSFKTHAYFINLISTQLNSTKLEQQASITRKNLTNNKYDRRTPK